MSPIPGTVGESLFLAEAIRRDWNVCLPFCTTYYDCLIEKAGEIRKIQIKTTEVIHDRNNHKHYRVKIGTKYDMSKVDFICVYLPEIESWYILPMHLLKDKTNIRISSEGNGQYEQYKNNWSF